MDDAKAGPVSGFGACRSWPVSRSIVSDRLWRISLWIAYRLLLIIWYAGRPKRRGVFIGVWCGDELLVIRNSYRSWYALPCGGIKRGETPAQAASRELREEVGIEAAPDDLRFVREIPTTFEYKRDRCSFFELTLLEKPQIRTDGREVVWASFVPSSQLGRLRVAPPVREYLETR